MAMTVAAYESINPKSVMEGHGYLVVKQYANGKFRIVESWADFKSALKAAGILNDYDLACGNKVSHDVYETHNVTIAKD